MKPLNHKIQLDIPEVSVGAIKTDTIAERGTIIALGEDVDARRYAVGDVLIFKAWAVDVATHDGQKYYFIDDDSTALLAYGTD